MKRVLTFEPTDAHRRIFQAIYGAMRFGRQMATQAPGKQVLRQERDIFRALEAVSVADAKDPKARELALFGGSVALTQEQIELIVERIDKGPWGGDAACDMADALDFIGAAPEQQKA
jgi:hypothetical protein